MMSIEYIQSLANEAGHVARQNKTEPLVVAENPILDEDLRGMPDLGDYVPEDWELVETHFVDSSGLGAEDEAALTFWQFVTLVRTEIAKPNEIFGWALMSAGQFQVNIGQFRSTL